MLTNDNLHLPNYQHLRRSFRGLPIHIQLGRLENSNGERREYELRGYEDIPFVLCIDTKHERTRIAFGCPIEVKYEALVMNHDIWQVDGGEGGWDGSGQ
jgi:hypothetical protein